MEEDALKAITCSNSIQHLIMKYVTEKKLQFEMGSKLQKCVSIETKIATNTHNDVRICYYFHTIGFYFMNMYGLDGFYLHQAGGFRKQQCKWNEIISTVVFQT